MVDVQSVTICHRQRDICEALLKPGSELASEFEGFQSQSVGMTWKSTNSCCDVVIVSMGASKSRAS